MYIQCTFCGRVIPILKKDCDCSERKKAIILLKKIKLKNILRLKKIEGFYN
jgi:hypothetical protein